MEWLKSITPILELPAVHLPLILIGSVLLGLLAQFLIGRVIHRLTLRTKVSFDDRLVELLRRPVSLSVVLFGCWYALRLCDLSPTTYTLSKSILLTLAIAVWTLASLGIARLIIEVLSAERERFRLIQPQTKPLMLIVSQGLIVGLGLYFLSRAWNQDVTAWLASAGIIGVAVGFAAKDTLANFFSGVFIIADGPYKLGHYIVLDNGLRGRVTHIGIRSTRILTRDDVEVTVPNAVIGNSTIVNESGGPHEKFRVRVGVSVSYSADIGLVEKLLLEIATSDSLAQEHPEPRVRFRRFGDSGLDFELLIWVSRPEFRGLAVHQLNSAIYKAFAQHEIEIPYPKRDVYLHNASKRSG